MWSLTERYCSATADESQGTGDRILEALIAATVKPRANRLLARARVLGRSLVVVPIDSDFPQAANTRKENSFWAGPLGHLA